MKYYKVSEEELQELLRAYHELMALNQGGVDNWSWCGDSCSDYLERYRNETGSDVEYFEDIGELELENYEIVG